MLWVSVFDLDGNRVQVNGGSIAYYTQDKAGKGSVIAFAMPGDGGFATLRVADKPEEITTQIQAKLRK